MRFVDSVNAHLIHFLPVQSVCCTLNNDSMFTNDESSREVEGPAR